MDPTITDLSKFVAALVRGDGLSKASRAEMTKQQLHITTATRASSERAPERSLRGLGCCGLRWPAGTRLFQGAPQRADGKQLEKAENYERDGLNSSAGHELSFEYKKTLQVLQPNDDRVATGWWKYLTIVCMENPIGPDRWDELFMTFGQNDG
jgi:hypothetical protein